MKIKNSFFAKGNTEYYDFDIEIVYLTKEDKKEPGYYIIFLPIFKYNKRFDKLENFKLGYKLVSSDLEDDNVLNQILSCKHSLVEKYILKIESKLKEKHLKEFKELKEEVQKDSNEKKSIVEKVNFSKNKNENLNKESVKLRDLEKNIIAYHESGHAIAGLLLEERNIEKISIIPNEKSLGHTSNSYKEETYLNTQTELLNKIKFLLAGKVAEELIFGEHSTGVYDDLKRSSEIALNMVCKYGMGNRASLFINPFTKDSIAPEDIKKAETILSSANKEVTELLKEHKKELKVIASELYNEEELDISFIKSVLDNTLEKETAK